MYLNKRGGYIWTERSTEACTKNSCLKNYWYSSFEETYLTGKIQKVCHPNKIKRNHPQQMPNLQRGYQQNPLGKNLPKILKLFPQTEFANPSEQQGLTGNFEAILRLPPAKLKNKNSVSMEANQSDLVVLTRRICCQKSNWIIFSQVGGKIKNICETSTQDLVVTFWFMMNRWFEPAHIFMPLL